MSNRRAKREKHELKARGRLRFLLAVLSLEDLQRLGVVPDKFVEKPTASTLERMLDERLKTFQKADVRLRGKKSPLQGVSPIASVYKAIQGKEVTGLFVDELHNIPAGETP